MPEDPPDNLRKHQSMFSAATHGDVDTATHDGQGHPSATTTVPCEKCGMIINIGTGGTHYSEHLDSEPCRKQVKKNAADQITWIGDLHVKDVSPHSCWVAGRKRADVLVVRDKKALDPDFVMFAPSLDGLLIGAEDAGDTGGQQPTPDVRFSGDIMVVLKKMDILRLERNNKRAERRTAGEANVSDDEEDDLTPYYLGNVSGGSPLPNVGTAAAPQVTGNAPTVPNVVAANSKVLFTDQKAANNSFRANDNTIPNAIFSLAKNGISPPLTLFLPISLDRIRSSNVKTVKHGDVSDFPDETAAESHIVRGFSLHYNNILSDAALDTWFPAYRSFDRQIRAQFFTEPYIIDVQSAEYRNALQSAKDNHMWSSVHSPSSSGSRSGAPSGRERGERPKPYDRDTQPQSDGGTALVWTQPSVAPGIAFTTSLTPAAFEESTSSHVTGTSNLVVQSYQERRVGAEEVPFGHATGVSQRHEASAHDPGSLMTELIPSDPSSPSATWDWPDPVPPSSASESDTWRSTSPPFDGFDNAYPFTPELFRACSPSPTNSTTMSWGDLSLLRVQRPCSTIHHLEPFSEVAFDPGSFPPSSMSPIDHFDWPSPAVDGYTSPSPPFDGFDDSSFASESLRTSASALPSSSM
ncbi:hypothetical protein C8R46DRAFT_1283859 [Mycena filopes]|nr:hypothetical protein C8R46DRAFT_1283859 [Mycena filopes]